MLIEYLSSTNVRFQIKDAMMVLPGLLVEYLVVGSMALLWLLPLAGVGFQGKIPFELAAALAPTIYVVGMFIDFLGFVFVSRLPIKRYSLKSLVRKLVQFNSDITYSVENIFKEGSGRSSRGIIWLYKNAPDLVKEVQARSSRDRVARGALVNIFILWFFQLPIPARFFRSSRQSAQVFGYWWRVYLLPSGLSLK